MKRYVFSLGDGLTVIIEAESIMAAIRTLRDDWYPALMEEGFTVKVATGYAWLREDGKSIAENGKIAAYKKS